MPDLKQLEHAVQVLERAMDDAYARHASAGEEEQINGVRTALNSCLDAVPEALRKVALQLLAEKYEPDGPRTEDASLAAELALLRAEAERLQAELTRERATGNVGLVKALLGEESLGRVEPIATERVVQIVRLLEGFARDLGDAFLSTAKEGGAGKPSVRVREAIREDLGSESGAALERTLGELRHAVALQVRAFPRACNEGAAHLLRELEPLLIEDSASAKGLKILGWRPYRFRELWEAFERRYAELVASGEYYQTYFDGPIRAALFRLRDRAQGG